MECLKIKINPTAEDKLDIIFEKFLLQVEEQNTYIPRCWNWTIYSFNDIIIKNRSLFTKNTRNGVKYLLALMWNTVCRRCDVYACKWLYDFACAWLVRNEPPIFVDCTCSNSIYSPRSGRSSGDSI